MRIFPTTIPLLFLWSLASVQGQDVPSTTNAISSRLSTAQNSLSASANSAQSQQQQQPQQQQQAQPQQQPPEPTPGQRGIILGPANQANNVIPTQEGPTLPLTCPENCLIQMRGDGWCNTECATEECENDNGDCVGWCAPDCRKEWVGDKWCDRDCFREECEWDGGDCDIAFQHGDVVFPPRPHDGFDYTPCECQHGMLHNGKCDAACNTKECNWDGNDCRHFCAPGCITAWQGDGECDSACYNEACGYDKGDCKECSPGCRPDRIGNGICDGACMTDPCYWDMGDCAGVCKVYPVDYNELPFEYNLCRNEWTGDGFCDCFCMNPYCNNDKGDCEGKENSCAAKIAAAESRHGGVYPTPVPGSAEDLALQRTTATSTPKVIGSRDRGFAHEETSPSIDAVVQALQSSDDISEES